MNDKSETCLRPLSPWLPFLPSGLLFSPSFPFCLSVVVRLSSFSLSGIGTCRLFPAADFSPSSYCLFLPAVRFAFFCLFPFACPLLFACRRFRCPALGPAGFSPRRIFRQRLIVFSFPSSGSLFSVFFLLPVFPFLVCLFLRRFLYLIFLFCFSLLSFLRFVFSFLQGSGKRP